MTCVAAPEIRERADRRLGARARTRSAAHARRSAARRFLRLGRDQRGDDADQRPAPPWRHSPRSTPRAWPSPKRLEAADEKQRPRRRGQHADPVAPRHRTPCRRPARFHRGFRPGRHRRRCPGSPTRSRPSGRPSATSHGSTAGSQDRRKTIAAIKQSCESTSQPRRRPKQARQQRHIERIDQRRPQEFHRVGRADQREQPDGPQIDARLGHPHAAASTRTSASGRPEEKPRNMHDQHAAAQIDRQRLRPGRLCGRHRLRDRRHGRRPSGAASAASHSPASQLAASAGRSATMARRRSCAARRCRRNRARRCGPRALPILSVEIRIWRMSSPAWP